MTLMETLFMLTAICGFFWFVGHVLTSISDPAQRREMGIRLPEDDSD